VFSSQFTANWTATPGNHTPQYIADYFDNIPESNEGNNTTNGSSINILAPDLIVTSIAAASELHAGNSGTINVTVKNNGTATAGSSTTRIQVPSSSWN